MGQARRRGHYLYKIQELPAVQRQVDDFPMLDHLTDFRATLIEHGSGRLYLHSGRRVADFKRHILCHRLRHLHGEAGDLVDLEAWRFHLQLIRARIDNREHIVPAGIGLHGLLIACPLVDQVDCGGRHDSMSRIGHTAGDTAG
jgi:hypothetical protein